MGEEFRNFTFRGLHLFHAPVDDILWGFTFGPRPGNPHSRWLHAYGQPLLIPRDGIAMNFGRRIPNANHMGQDAFPIDLGTDEELTEVARIMKTEGFDVLESWNSIAAFRRTLAKVKTAFDSHVCEASAVLAARENDFVVALGHIATFETYIDALESGDAETLRAFYGREPNREYLFVREWQWPIIERLRALREPCQRGDREAVQALLNEWRAYTIAQLGIEDICLP